LSETSEATGLDGLRPGEEGEVRGVDAPEALAVRLADLGFCPGTRVRVIRRAPLRDPILYELRGYRIALRRAEARRIRVVRRGGP
jgi:Fe2+ transport system protein FeoA